MVRSKGMVQPDFAEALILRLKEKGIHTAIETTGHIKSSVFRRLAPQFDLLLNREYEFTGVKTLHPEGLKGYQQVFLDRGMECFF